MEKLNLEQQKRGRRVEQEKESLCQKLFDLEHPCEHGVSSCSRTKSEQYPLRKRIIKRSQTSDLSFTSLSPQSPMKFTSSPESPLNQHTEIRRSKSVKIRAQTSPFAFDSSTSQQIGQKLFRRNSYNKAPTSLRSSGADVVSSRRLSMSQLDAEPELTPEWHLALANKRRERQAQLQVFREQGQWPDYSPKVSALLSGCPFASVPPGNSALSHSSDASRQPCIDEDA